MNPMTDERRRDNIAYWRKMSRAAPYHAQAPTLEPSPTDVERDLGLAETGDHFMAVPLGDNVTYWAFFTREGRGAFLLLYPSATELAAEAVFGNPV